MKCIAIASGKGGVGKTTIALNLATALNHYGRQVILVDANFHYPHVGLMLGKSAFEETIISIIEHKKPLREAVYKHQSGLKIVPGNISLEQLHKKDVHALMSKLSDLKEVSELVLLDTPAGLGDDNLHILQQSDALIFVTTPDFLALSETLRTIRMAQHHKRTIMGVIVNRSARTSSDLHPENIEKLLKQKVIAVIPEDKAIRESLRLKYPSVYSHPNAASTEEFLKLACNLVGKPYQKEQPKKQTKFMQAMEKVGLKQWYESLMEDDNE